ncbi:hypothetical protein PAAG_06453 [Paracoccidioides lutzii Pb01]|uniref:Uncharacterized protein n=1 Tax=Paracoccidioides lutzii (strain ATCC MYA-826 / Pb01) TaxID=502779 RepID=C1H6R2_PARBA|nr:hypothetical protein PAAG_06453 [Paracoccidioides lutzii Pb01]EEH35406.2 hypothetical protein PAAG_06453 [Paracoccidioides lutzii Pb01]
MESGDLGNGEAESTLETMQPQGKKGKDAGDIDPGVQDRKIEPKTMGEKIGGLKWDRVEFKKYKSKKILSVCSKEGEDRIVHHISVYFQD